MTYQIKHTNHSFWSRNFFKIILVFVPIFIFVVVFIFSATTRSFFYNIFSPFFRTGNFFYDTLNWAPKLISDKNKIIAENTKLATDLENLHKDFIDYDSLKYENQKLREELKLKPVGDFLTASVLAKSPQIPIDTLLLDSGESHGIKNEDFVLASEKILIGKIVKVSSKTSIVSLSSFAGQISYAFVARTKESLEIKGAGGSSLEAKVPLDFDIASGDKIMIGGATNYLVAVVGAIESEDTSSGFKTILMSLPIDISKVNLVFIKSNV